MKIMENGVSRDATPEEIASFVVAPPPPLRRIAALAFRRRLGEAHLAAITLAAAEALRADPPDATLQVMLDNLTAARWVDLDDPELLLGLTELVGRGLLTEAERDALLVDGLPEEAPA